MNRYTVILTDSTAENHYISRVWSDNKELAIDKSKANYFEDNAEIEEYNIVVVCVLEGLCNPASQ